MSNFIRVQIRNSRKGANKLLMSECEMISELYHICDQDCENHPCECKLHQVIFLLISFKQNVVSQFLKLQKKAH